MSNVSLVLEGLNSSKQPAHISNMSAALKGPSTHIGVTLDSEVKSRVKKKKKKKESLSHVEVPRELMALLLQTLQMSTLNLTQVLYRKLLHCFFEFLMNIEERAKTLSTNRDFILQYLETLLKLLIRRDVNVEPSQNSDLFGTPSMFPLKLKASKLSSMKKPFSKLDKKFTISSKNALFNNRKHSNQILLMFRRIAQKAQTILGFSVEEASHRFLREKQVQIGSRKGRITSASRSSSNLRSKANRPF